jgi:hypothetical protein
MRAADVGSADTAQLRHEDSHRRFGGGKSSIEHTSTVTHFNPI